MTNQHFVFLSASHPHPCWAKGWHGANPFGSWRSSSENVPDHHRWANIFQQEVKVLLRLGLPKPLGAEGPAPKGWHFGSWTSSFQRFWPPQTLWELDAEIFAGENFSAGRPAPKCLPPLQTFWELDAQHRNFLPSSGGREPGRPAPNARKWPNPFRSWTSSSEPFPKV